MGGFLARPVTRRIQATVASRILVQDPQPPDLNVIEIDPGLPLPEGLVFEVLGGHRVEWSRTRYRDTRAFAEVVNGLLGNSRASALDVSSCSTVVRLRLRDLQHPVHIWFAPQLYVAELELFLNCVLVAEPSEIEPPPPLAAPEAPTLLESLLDWAAGGAPVPPPRLPRQLYTVHLYVPADPARHCELHRCDLRWTPASSPTS